MTLTLPRPTTETPELVMIPALMPARRTVTVEVTQTDIDAANCDLTGALRSRVCPVAQALTRTFGGHASVGPFTFSLLGSSRWLVRSLPDNAARFVHDYDSLLPVQPFTFEVTLDG